MTWLFAFWILVRLSRRLVNVAESWTSQVGTNQPALNPVPGGRPMLENSRMSFWLRPKGIPYDGAVKGA